MKKQEAIDDGKQLTWWSKTTTLGSGAVKPQGPPSRLDFGGGGVLFLNDFTLHDRLEDMIW